ncbi:MAG TPA: hypothetical protein VMZ33_03045 [Candidatus Limnocylindrales bacterium]|nr:hypothetical protein [Candidatus Limnocylindrales bacterium]
MAYNRRPRRQGVVYGPPRPEGTSENGVLFGRFLGLGLIALTLGLLGVGIVAFLDRQNPSATPGRSAVVAASVSFLPPTIAPSGATTLPPATPTPLVTPTGETPTPTGPAPSTTPLPVQEGPGFVTFGTQADEELRITDPRTTFTMQEQVVWSAYLTRPADSSTLRIQIAKADDSTPNGERQVVDAEVTPEVVDGQIFQRRFRPNRLLDGAGVYIVRYVAGTEILAQGTIQVTR